MVSLQISYDSDKRMLVLLQQCHLLQGLFVHGLYLDPTTERFSDQTRQVGLPWVGLWVATLILGNCADLQSW